MHRQYNDIISRIDLPPIWWQEAGVPRYDQFDPHMSTGVYANEAALAEIACQVCEATFLVLIETPNADRSIAAKIANQTLDYGDPPNVACACGGSASMSSIMVRVVEYWAKADQRYVQNGIVIDNRYHQWVRDKSLEITFEDSPGSGTYTPPRGVRWVPEQKADQKKRKNVFAKLISLLSVHAR
jgi:hypothetical protein